MFSKLSERQLWSLIVQAETLSEIAAHYHKDGKQGVMYMQIGLRARQELYHRFNINLDILSDETNECLESIIENWKM